MDFASIPFLANVTPPPSGGSGFIRFLTLSNVTESGDGSTGWIYTATANAGSTGGADYSVASGVAGGMAVQVDPNTAWGAVLFRTVDLGDWTTDTHIIAFADGTNWACNDGSFNSLITTARTYEADDWVKITFGTGNNFLVQIARAATPTTWLTLATGSLTRGATVYPRLQSLIGGDAVFTAPRVETS